MFVCTWTAEHLPMVRLVAEAGTPLFCEKPLSLDLPRSRELVQVVRGAGIVNMVGLVMRSSPTLLVMREMIHDPSSGRVMNVVFRDDQYIPTQGMYASTWRGDIELAGSGALMEHSIHDLDPTLHQLEREHRDEPQRPGGLARDGAAGVQQLLERERLRERPVAPQQGECQQNDDKACKDDARRAHCSAESAQGGCSGKSSLFDHDEPGAVPAFERWHGQWHHAVDNQPRENP